MSTKDDLTNFVVHRYDIKIPYDHNGKNTLCFVEPDGEIQLSPENGFDRFFCTKCKEENLFYKYKCVDCYTEHKMDWPDIILKNILTTASE